MQPEKTLLLIGHPTEAVLKAKALGLDVILFQHKSKFDQAQAEYADVVVLMDYTDHDSTLALAEAAHRAWGFSVALSMTDPGLEIAGQINDLYDLPGTGFAVSHLLRDKWAMRQRLAGSGSGSGSGPGSGSGLATVGARLVTDHDSMLAFGKAYGYPFIVKPADLSGGFGVNLINSATEVDAAWTRLRGWQEEGMGKGPSSLLTVGDFVMEEYIDGPEYSVEAFSFSGRHVVVAVTEKMVDDKYFAELGHVVPARVTPALEQDIVTAVTSFLDAMGLTDGPSHTEIRVGPHGPAVIESHNRAGGDRIRDLVQAVYGIDLTRYIVGWPFGLVEELPERPIPAGGACVRFFHGAAGRVEAVRGLAEVREHPDVIAAEAYVKAGDTVRPLRDNFDRLGLVAVSGPDSDAAVRRCEELIENLVRIDVIDVHDVHDVNDVNDVAETVSGERAAAGSAIHS
jgi:biotin carboxylase